MDSTEKCWLEYVDGELLCRYNHEIGEDCLMKRDDEDEQNDFDCIENAKFEFDERERLRERMVDGEIDDALLSGDY